ncbi:MAG: hypothetical protein J6I46_11920 [Ruminococcus sp.]|nr:hypothetical protein [Ruminococcus sp.]
MGASLPFNFQDMDFGSGELGFYMNSCDEETPLLAQIAYPDNFDIMVEHSNEELFMATVYWSYIDHTPPVAVYSTKDIRLLKKALAEAVERAERELSQRRFSYYGPLWETEYIEITE